jgi:hypothetical protein
VVPPELFALNATNRTIGNLFLGRTIIDNMEGKPSLQVPENAKSFNRLASRPKPDLLKAIPRQICPTNSNGVFQKAHVAVPAGSIVTRVQQTCFKKIPIWQSHFQISD